MKLILLLILVSCNRSPSQIGVIEHSYEFDCVKSSLAPGMTFNGDFSLTSICTVTKCFEVERKLGEYLWSSEVISKKLVDDSLCIGE